MRLPTVLPVLLLLSVCGSSPPPPPPPEPKKLVVAGYFTERGVYERGYLVKDLETSDTAARLTHLKYAFAKVTGGRSAVGDELAAHRKPITAADGVDGVAAAEGNFGQLRRLKARQPGLRLLWSFGGWNGSADRKSVV